MSDDLVPLEPSELPIAFRSNNILQAGAKLTLGAGSESIRCSTGYNIGSPLTGIPQHIQEQEQLVNSMAALPWTATPPTTIEGLVDAILEAIYGAVKGKYKFAMWLTRGLCKAIAIDTLYVIVAFTGKYAVPFMQWVRSFVGNGLNVEGKACFDAAISILSTPIPIEISRAIERLFHDRSIQAG